MLNYPIYYDPKELTKRENEILELVYDGLELKEIGAELSITLSTVQTHLQSIFDKKEIRSKRELMAARIKDLEEKLNEFTSTTN